MQEIREFMYIHNESKSFDIDINIYNLWADENEVFHEYGIRIFDSEEKSDCNLYFFLL